MICPMCQSDYVVTETKEYDSERVEECRCIDCKHVFPPSAAIPYSMRLPINDNIIGDEPRD